MRLGRRIRPERAVLEALATVGEVGMSSVSLAVTTDLPEGRLQAALDHLLVVGLVHRRAVGRDAAPPRACAYYCLAARGRH